MPRVARLARCGLPSPPLIADRGLRTSRADELYRLLLGLPMVDRATYLLALPRLFPTASVLERARVWEQYAPSRFKTVRAALYSLGTDGYYYCPTRHVVRAVAAAHRAAPRRVADEPPVFEYIFAAKASPADTPFLLEGWPTWLVDVLKPLLKVFLFPWLGSFHGYNTYMLWADDAGLKMLRPQERQLSRRLVAHWSSFVKTGRALPSWPSAAGARAGEWYEFNVNGDSAQPDYHRDECAVLDQLRFVWNPPTLSGGPSDAVPALDSR